MNDPFFLPQKKSKPSNKRPHKSQSRGGNRFNSNNDDNDNGDNNNTRRRTLYSSSSRKAPRLAEDNPYSARPIHDDNDDDASDSESEHISNDGK